MARLLLFFLGLACGVQALVCVGEFIDPLGKTQHALQLSALCLISLATPLALGTGWERTVPALTVSALLAGSYLLMTVCRHLRRMAQAGVASTTLNALTAALSLCAAPALLAAWGALVFFRRSN